MSFTIHRFAPMLVCILAGCAVPPDHSTSPPTSRTPSPDPKSLDINYADWPRVTEKPYSVSTEFLMMCREPSPEMIQKRESLEKARGPHSKSAIIVRVNPTGLAQFKAGEAVPVGTVVIKEKYPEYDPNARPVAIAAMIKREAGYDPDHGDWEYAFEQLSPEQERKTVRGKLDNCIECHKGTRSKDYLFRPYLKASR
jgi:hypothetical protein